MEESRFPEVNTWEEDFVVQFDPSPPGDEIDTMEKTIGDMISRTCLVGKVYSQRKFSAGSVKTNLAMVWTINGDLKVTNKGNNLFLLNFESNCERILKGSPWLVSNAHTNFQRWLPHLSNSQIPCRMSMVWVQLHELPLSFLDETRIKKLLSVFPTNVFLEDKIEHYKRWRGFVRAKVEFLPENPLIPGIHVLDQQNKEHSVKIKYERLGEFYIRCGRITHAVRWCNKTKRADEGVERASVFSYGSLP